MFYLQIDFTTETKLASSFIHERKGLKTNTFHICTSTFHYCKDITKST